MTRFIPGFAAGYITVLAWRFAEAAMPLHAVLTGIVSGLLYAVAIYGIVTVSRRRSS